MKTKSIKPRILEYFFLNPTIKLRVREIERKTSSPLPSVIRYTKELEEENLLKSELISNIKLYSANRASKDFLLGKKLFNIKQVQELSNHLIKELNNPTIILFGSYSKGEDIENSDIDLYVETPSNKEINLRTYEALLQRTIQLFKYRNIKEIKNKELANNIINGITLNKFLEVF